MDLYQIGLLYDWPISEKISDSDSHRVVGLQSPDCFYGGGTVM